MKPLSLKQMELNAVKAAFKFEQSKAADICRDDERGPVLMQLTDDEINEVLESVMPRSDEDAHILRIVRWMEENSDGNFQYSNIVFEWLCYPHDAKELALIIHDYAEAEGLKITHLFWFHIRRWLESEITVALNGETMKSETEKRAAVYLSRWEKYKAGAS